MHLLQGHNLYWYIYFLIYLDIFNMKLYVQKELMIQRIQKVKTMTNWTEDFSSFFSIICFEHLVYYITHLHHPGKTSNLEWQSMHLIIPFRKSQCVFIKTLPDNKESQRWTRDVWTGDSKVISCSVHIVQQCTALFTPAYQTNVQICL